MEGRRVVDVLGRPVKPREYKFPNQSRYTATKEISFTNCSIAQEIFAENQDRQSAAFTGATTVTA
jgi:hypothetical protein